MMKKWVLKAIVQKTISFLPFSFSINYWFQKHISKGAALTEEFTIDILKQAKRLMESTENDFQNKSVLELGTGWYPIAPIALYLCGANDIITVDIRSHLRKENIQSLQKMFLKLQQEGKLQQLLPDLLPEKWKLFQKTNWNQKPIDFLNTLNLKCVVGALHQADLNHDHYQICFSINVGQHIQEKKLKDIFKTLFTLSTKNSLHYHFIGCYDHFIQVDSKISKFNYFKFSKTQWVWIDNRIQSQNRWRAIEFQNLFDEIGYLTKTTYHSSPNWLELDKLEHISDSFTAYERDDLAIDYACFVLTK